MLGRASSHNCSCASFEQVLSPFQQKPFLSGVSHRDTDVLEVLFLAAKSAYQCYFTQELHNTLLLSICDTSLLSPRHRLRISAYAAQQNVCRSKWIHLCENKPSQSDFPDTLGTRNKMDATSLQSLPSEQTLQCLPLSLLHYTANHLISC